MKIGFLAAILLLAGVVAGGVIAPSTPAPTIGDAWSMTPAASVIVISHQNDPCQEDEALVYTAGSHPYRVCMTVEELCQEGGN